MDVAGVLLILGIVAAVAGILMVLLGVLPPTRPRFHDLAGWGAVLFFLGAMILLVLLMVGVASG